MEADECLSVASSNGAMYLALLLQCLEVGWSRYGPPEAVAVSDGWCVQSQLHLLPTPADSALHPTLPCTSHKAGVGLRMAAQWEQVPPPPSPPPLIIHLSRGMVQVRLLLGRKLAHRPPARDLVVVISRLTSAPPCTAHLGSSVAAAQKRILIEEPTSTAQQHGSHRPEVRLVWGWLLW